MAVINHAKREINAKIVYFGPPGCGKGELFRFIHQRIKPSLCGPLKTMPAGQDSLLFFDYIPFETSSLDGYRIRFHLYTMTGPVTNPGTWKMTLKGVDGIALVTNGGASGGDEATESLRVLRSMLTSYGRDLYRLPRVWLPSGPADSPDSATEFVACFDASRTVVCSASTGEGILRSLALLSQEVLQELRDEYEPADELVTDPISQAAISDELLVGSRLENGGESAKSITLPELKVSLTGSTSVTIPLVIQSGESVKRCNLCFSVQLKEELP
jgi:uncharacterized protein